MFIEKIIVDGFKSYATRTVIAGFDPEFNAITGLNGSGKSNILDSICFVLGITNLSQVRVGNLQELVYKQGQAGVTKASVTLVFDNSNKEQSPVGYDQFDQITVTRQVVIGGRSKYMINGHTAQASRIQNLFHSVQLNVNNPHFLIMQGRITKVLNMKPPEILAMIEEAAGTRMFETKKQAALKTIEKKESKVLEINKILAEDITPLLEKLRTDRQHYTKWSANNTECERLARFCVAFEFVQAQARCSKSSTEKAELDARAEELAGTVERVQSEAAAARDEVAQLSEKRASELEGDMEQVVKAEQEASKALVQANSLWQNQKTAVADESKSIDSLRKQEQDTKTQLEKLTAKAEKQQAKVTAAKEAAASAKQQSEALQQQLQAVSAGLDAANADGEAVSAKELLMSTRTRVGELETAISQHDMRARALEASLPELEATYMASQSAVRSLEQAAKKAAEDVAAAEGAISGSAFDAKQFAQMNDRRTELQRQIESQQERVDQMSASISARVKFEYSTARLGKSWNPAAVKGTVAQLIRVRDARATTALEVAAGGRLFQVVVDNEATGKQLLQHGGLRRRVTIIPLNKVRQSRLRSSQVEQAAKLSDGTASPAIELVGYDEEVAAAMQYAFGTTIICPDAETAKRVCFHPSVKAACVTYDGDSFDPAGTLEGGSRSQQASVLTRLAEYNEQNDLLLQLQDEVQQITARLQKLGKDKAAFDKLTAALDMKQHALKLAEDKLARSDYGQKLARFNDAKAKLEAERTSLEAATTELDEKRSQLKSLEKAAASASSTREQRLAEIEASLSEAKAHTLRAHAAFKEQETVVIDLDAEMSDLREELTGLAAAIDKAEAALAAATAECESMGERVAEAKVDYEDAKAALDAQRHALARCDSDMRAAVKKQEKAEKESTNAELELKQVNHKITRFNRDTAAAEQSVKQMLKKHLWIASEQDFFGKANTDYDFKARNPQAARERLGELEAEQAKLSKKINKKVIGMIETAEKEYQELTQKRRIVENDKAKIKAVIEELDEKKNEALQKTWLKVNRDFGSIFSMLLPGTEAKLEPPEGGTVLDGLCVRVAFGGVWKDSLSELSGGQRSLLALSLILSLLLFKPAPMYILDEVDAALDLSHTQNIGQMLRSHFKHSQFIVVSLKQGMFNNANVVFKTKFVDGVSTVTRTVPAGSSLLQGGGGVENVGADEGRPAKRTARSGGRAATSVA